jgi:hypothetical protein
MDGTIEILSEKVQNSLSGWPLGEQAYMMREIADRLIEMAGECLKMEYVLTDGNE